MDHRFNPATNELDFERFSRDLLRKHWPDSNPQRWGRRGQKQHGVDIVDMNAVEPLRAGQSKFKKLGVVITPEEVEKEVHEARSFNLNGLRLGHYTILTTSENDTAAQAKVIELNRDHRQRGLFMIELLTWEAIEEILREHPGLWEETVGRTFNALTKPLEASMGALQGRLLLIHQRLDEQLPPSGSGDEIQQRLDAVKVHLDSYRRSEAQLLLGNLKTNEWHEMSGAQRFLTLTYLARVASAEGKWEKAGQLFLEAEQHLPGDERAKTNRALGLEFLDERDKAYTLARELAEEYPTSARPWAVICRTAADDVLARDLEAELPNAAKADDEVMVALAMRALRQHDWAAAERLSKKATHDDVDWAAPWTLLGQAKLQLAAEKAYKPAEGASAFEQPEAVVEVIQLFDRAVEIATRTHSDFLLIQALIERSRAKDISGDDAGAEKDLLEAYEVGPNDPVAVVKYGQYLLNKGECDAAILLLRKAVRLDGSPDAKFMLALALHSKKEAKSRVEWIELARETAESSRCSYSYMAMEMALEGLLQDGKKEEVEGMLDRLRKAGWPHAALQAGNARIALAEGERKVAMRNATSAIESLDDSSTQCRRFVADTLTRIGDHARAFPEWQVVAEKSRQIPDAWSLVETAKRLNRDDVVLKTAREWREAGVRDERLIEEELTVLERYEPHRAIDLIEQELEHRPDDPLLLLRRSMLGLLLDRTGLIHQNLHELLPPDEAGPHNGSLVVHLLVETSQNSEAVEYAYRLLRFHPRSPETHSCFVSAILRRPDVVSDEFTAAPDVVQVGTAVRYTEDGSEEQRWFVVEDDSGGTGFDDEFPADHRFSQAAMGLRLGDTFVFSGDEIDGRKAEITAIETKYTYRVRDVLDGWQVRFPSHPGIAMFRAKSESADEEQIPDLMPIIRRTHARKRRVAELLGYYRDKVMSIHLLAEAMGVDYGTALSHLAQGQEHFVRCCSGGPADFQKALLSLRAANHCVLDVSGIITLQLLGLEDRLAKWPMPLIVSTNTLVELCHLRDHVRDVGEQQVVPTDTDVGVAFVENDPDALTQERKRVERLIDLVKSHTEIRDCGELAELDPERRQFLLDAFGQHGAESIVLAAVPGHVLWTDDAVVAAFAQREQGVRRVWSQIALEGAVLQGALSEDELYEASARLLGFCYESTMFSQAVFRAACRLADGRTSQFPLRQVLKVLSQEHAPKTNVQIAEELIYSLYTDTILHPRLEEVAIVALDKIADGPLGTRGVKAVGARLLQRFRFDLQAERAVKQLVQRWLEIRGEV